ncbi:CDP-archaeol synthase [Candidatus Parcubacteria bacterium]|nr:CDP-archaeol synthase [Candidatus Parcubacteria bacterium]
MAPVIFNRTLNFLDYPVDFGVKVKGHHLFGRTKTFRGFMVGILAAILIVYLQSQIAQYTFFYNISLVDFNEINIWLFGFLFGLAALTGDLIKSFFKRRLGKKSSESWKVFDQLDFVFGSLFLVWLYIGLKFINVLIILFLSFILTIIANHISYILGIRKVKW